MAWLPAFLLVAFVAGAHAQSTAQLSVAHDLRECYMDPFLLDRNNLPPATIGNLIDIIRRIEDNVPNMDLRVLATLLLHTYRQDGIEHHPNSAANVLPFSPTFFSFHRHLMVLRLVPTNLQTLPNNTITSQMKCALHHMLSTTVDSRVRGDENNCPRLAQYRALRSSRFTRSVNEDDVEILDLAKLGADKNGHMQMSPDGEVEYADEFTSARQVARSTCPITTGVVDTPWGAVSGGNLIAGIAAGAESQQVAIRDLVNTNLNYQNVPQFINTIYAATLSGDLAEAVLIQGTAGATSITIGNAGNWNTSQATRFHMLGRATFVEMTDPEIRGGIDGLILGANLVGALNTANNLRLSQLLDMYYSPLNGVFNTNFRACNRQELNNQNIPAARLIDETRAFAAVLDTVLPLQGTITGGLDNLVQSAVTNFQAYRPNLNDQNCAATQNSIPEFRRHKTNLYIAVDQSWPFTSLYPAISYLLDYIEVGKFGSSVTLLSAFDGSIVVDKTFSPSEFHSLYTSQRHGLIRPGVNLESSLNVIRELLRTELRNETASNYVGGNATVLLYFLNSGMDNVGNAREQVRLMNEQVPDLRILFATSNNPPADLSNLVRDPQTDIAHVNINAQATNVPDEMVSVLAGIRQVGLRVINPLCGADFSAGSSGTRQFDDFLEPGFINFYRVAPNYFFRDNGDTRVRIARNGPATGTLRICQSRTVARPTGNATVIGVDPNEINCQTLIANGNFDIGLSGACDGFETIGSCRPLFFSVELMTRPDTTVSVCTDPNVCRFPFNFRYQIQIENFRCFSNAATAVSSIIFVLFGLVLNMYRSL